MASGIEMASELNLKTWWESLKCLVKPTSSCGTEEVKDLRGAFHVNLRKAASLLGLEDIVKIPGKSNTSQCGSGLIWDFVELALFILTRLCEKLKNADLSVSQQKDIRSCLQFVVSLGIQPNLLPGVVRSVSENPALKELLHEDFTTDLQKYERLVIVVKALLMWCVNSSFRSLIISNIVHHLLGALFQLSYAPLKKPNQEVSHSLKEENSFVMTLEIWERLQINKYYFKTSLHQLVKETYQPKIFFELMMLQGNQGEHLAPLWLKKAASRCLTETLIQPGGVAALIRATFDSAHDTGSDWNKTSTIAKIITSPVDHKESIAAQLTELIRMSSSASHEVHPTVIACVRQMYEMDASGCDKLIIGPLFHLLDPVFSNKPEINDKTHVLLSEEEIDGLIKMTHACFASSSSNVSLVCLPGNILVPFISFFFKLFCKVQGSASVLYKQCEDILCHVFHDINLQELTKILKCILLEKNDGDVQSLSNTLCFKFGPNGGVCLEISLEPPQDIFSSSIEDSGDMLMILLEKMNESELSLLVFEVLLKMLVDIGMKPKSASTNSTLLETFEDTLAALMSSSEKHLGIVRLLAALVENDNVKRKLMEKPGPILTFIVDLFDSFVQGDSFSGTSENEELECIFVAFMILNVMLDKCGKDTDWSIFSTVIQPVKMIRDRTKNEELKRLASRVYNLVSTCGNEQDNAPTSHGLSQKTKCEEALHDACDPLLPIRGHALVQLTKLLLQRDQETLVKKEAVLCLFRENLSNSDSFIYLAAINGMVAFAAFQPDETVQSLTKEYIDISSAGQSSSRDPELRMKVGEILVKLVKELGGLAPKYKNELLNAFLVGVKDVDHLMRASSLSNLGEVCQILGFRVGPILRELLLCIQSVLKSDSAIEPRRASVMVVTLLLRGLEAGALSVLQDAVLELYRNLKNVYLNDSDDVVRLHAQLALEELGRLAQDFLFPKLPMEKKIQILP